MTMKRGEKASAIRAYFKDYQAKLQDVANKFSTTTGNASALRKEVLGSRAKKVTKKVTKKDASAPVGQVNLVEENRLLKVKIARLQRVLTVFLEEIL